MKGGIYQIVNIVTNDAYIGSAINLKNRKARHSRDLKANKHHNILLQRAVNKYGIKNFKFRVIEYVANEGILIEKEQLYINTLNPAYNICRIAGSTLGRATTEETKVKHRDYAKINNVRPPASTWEAKQLRVYKLDKETLEVIKEYDSLSSACRSVGKDATFASTISSCCKNKRYSAFGYRWVFDLEDIKNLRKKVPLVAWNKGLSVEVATIPILQYTLKGEFIREWESVKVAEKVVGKGVGNCARGTSNSSNGYKWKYKEIDEKDGAEGAS